MGRIGPEWKTTVLISLCFNAHFLNAHADQFSGHPLETNALGDVAQACDVDVVQEANVRQLFPILHDLRQTTFFRLLRVRLQNPVCHYWQDSRQEDVAEKDANKDGTCTGTVPTRDGPIFVAGAFGFSSMSAASTDPPEESSCSISSEESDGAVPGFKSQLQSAQLNDRLDRSMTSAEREAGDVRNLEEDNCEILEDFPTYFFDMCDGSNGNDEAEDVNLIKNPERNTGYNGSHIWQAMYNENCFEVGSGLPRGRFGGDPGMCYEERVLYRLLSGWHASTTISIAKHYYAPGTKARGAWSPNPQRFMETVGQHAERTKNLHFSFVVLLRAIKKAAPYLRGLHIATGNEEEDLRTHNLISRLLDSQVLSVCSPVFEAFDETQLFRTTSAEQRSTLKRQFKSVFQNITALVDCVTCQRCRLHAKVYALGLGSALKVLLTRQDLISQTTSRDEMVALINVLWKVSESLDDATQLTAQYEKAEHERRKSQDSQANRGTYDRMTSLESVRESWGLSTTTAADSDIGFSQVTRMNLLDKAIGSLKYASASGLLAADAEEQALRALVVHRPSDEILTLAKHYASDRPSLFVKLAVEASVAAAAGKGTINNVPASTEAIAIGSAGEPADVVIVGGGLAGMVAAMIMLDRGASVAMVEKQAYLGGNSGKASSGINAALETSVESLIADTTKSAGSLARRALIERLSNESASAVDWLRNRVSVDLSMRSQLGGHSVKRTLRPSNAFVGAELTFAAGEVLKKAAIERPNQFRLLTKSKWTGLRQSGTGWQATIEVNGTSIIVESTSMVIASGGFGHDSKEKDSLLLKNRPDLAEFPTTLGPQTTGDGVKIARGIGAGLVDMDRVQLHPTGFVDLKMPLETTKTLAAELLRGVGGLLLDRNGKRFTDELSTRQAVVNGELAAAEAGKAFPSPMPARTFALVVNAKGAEMADRHKTLYSIKGLLVKVNGFEGLAKHLNLSVASLNATFKAYNQAAQTGRDEFNRTVFPVGHWPIEENEHFYVGFVVPVIHYTMGGIAIDDEGRVLSKTNSEPIRGLYAIGEASGGVHGDNRLAGNSLLECTVFGHLVGRSLPISKKRPGRDPFHASREPSAAPESATGSDTGANRVISAEELARHSSRDEQVWVALNGRVYDLTEYVEEHPGGVEAVLDVAGMDGTEHFSAVHNKELLDAMGFEPIGVFNAGS